MVVGMGSNDRTPALDVLFSVFLIQLVIVSLFLFFFTLPIELILLSLALGGIGLIYIPIRNYRLLKSKSKASEE
jgi:hypothetical protein